MRRTLYSIMFALLLYGGGLFAADPVPPTIPNPVEGWSTHLLYTNQAITVAWDKVNQSQVTNYDITAYNMERKAFLVTGNVPQRDNPSISLVLGKSGHYIFFVRAVNENEPEEEYKYSPWSCSVKTEDVQNGVKFWAYSYLAPPGSITIE